jgi:hypothetical protein
MGKYHDERDRLGWLWLDEAARFECNGDDLDTVHSAELADELWHHALVAAEDPDFESEYDEWHGYIYDKDILLALEQSCYQGVLLKTGQRAVRLRTCPEPMISHLNWFFSLCSRHVRPYLALPAFVLVRLDRGRRTGNLDWSPAMAAPAIPASTFFRPATLLVRKYGR